MNKILLVDDDRELTSLLQELLDLEGFSVVVAHDGEQALELLDSSIDLLLLDVMMPKKNGIDTLKEVRQHHQTPVIMEVDHLLLNPGRQEASFDGQTLELTGTEFTLLYLLAQHLGQVVSREHLSQEVLGKRLTPFDRAIDMHISNLRRKLPERKDGQPWFKTLRGRGYLMVSVS